MQDIIVISTYNMSAAAELKPFVRLVNTFDSATTSSNQLSTGEGFFALMLVSVPQASEEASSLHRNSDNYIMHRANLDLVLRLAADFAHQSLGLLDVESFLSAVNTNAIAKEKDLAQLLLMAELIASVTVLTGLPTVYNNIRKLSKTDQAQLQGSVKRVMREYSLSRQKKVTPPPSSDDQSLAPQTPPPAEPSTPSPHDRSETEFYVMADVAATARRQVEELRQDLEDRDILIEKLQREVKSSEERYTALLEHSSRNERAETTALRAELEQVYKELQLLKDDELKRKTEAANLQVELLTEREKQQDVLREIDETRELMKRKQEQLDSVRNELKSAKDVSAATARRRADTEEALTKEKELNQSLKQQLHDEMIFSTKQKDKIQEHQTTCQALRNQIQQLETQLLTVESGGESDRVDHHSLDEHEELITKLEQVRGELAAERQQHRSCADELDLVKHQLNQITEELARQKAESVLKDKQKWHHVREIETLQMRLKNAETDEASTNQVEGSKSGSQNQSRTEQNASDSEIKARAEDESVIVSDNSPTAETAQDIETTKSTGVDENDVSFSKKIQHEGSGQQTQLVEQQRVSPSNADGDATPAITITTLEEVVSELTLKLEAAKTQQARSEEFHQEELASLNCKLDELDLRNRQLQQQLLAGGSALSTVGLFSETDSMDATGVQAYRWCSRSNNMTLLERQRANLERGLMRNLWQCIRSIPGEKQP